MRGWKSCFYLCFPAGKWLPLDSSVSGSSSPFSSPQVSHAFLSCLRSTVGIQERMGGRCITHRNMLSILSSLPFHTKNLRHRRACFCRSLFQPRVGQQTEQATFWLLKIAYQNKDLYLHINKFSPTQKSHGHVLGLTLSESVSIRV